MTVTLSDLIAGDSEEDVRTAMYGVLDAVGVPWSSWKSDGIAHTTLRIVSKLVAPMTTLVAGLAASAFRQYASGDWLTLLAAEVYGVDRIESTYASGAVTLTHDATFVGTYDPGDLIFRHATSGKTYTNVDTVVISGAGTTTVDIQAQEVGTASNANAGTIDAFVTTVLGVSDITNALPVVATDQESDTALRARCAAKIDSLSPDGPKYAYHYAATTAVDSDGVSLGITKVRTNDSSGNGEVIVYVATDDGAVSGTIGDETTALGAVDAAIQNQVVPLGITCTVDSADELEVDLNYSIRIYASELTDSDVQTNVAEAFDAWLTAQPIGGHSSDGETRYLYRDSLLAAIHAANPGTIDVNLTTPSADIEIDLSEVAIAGDITHGSPTWIQELT